MRESIIDNSQSKSVKATVGQRIKKAREGMNISRQAFCDAINDNNLRPLKNGGKEYLNVERLKQWEYGNNPVDLEWIPALCNALSVDVGFLFGDYVEKTRQISDIVKETGLSESSVNQIIGISPGSSFSRAFDLENEFDQFLSRYCFDLAFRLGQLRHAIESAKNTTAAIREETVTAENWEQLFDRIEVERRNLIIELFEFSEFSRRAQEELFPTSQIIECMNLLQRTIHKPKEAADNGE